MAKVTWCGECGHISDDGESRRCENCGEKFTHIVTDGPGDLERIGYSQTAFGVGYGCAIVVMLTGLIAFWTAVIAVVWRVFT